MVVSVSSSSSSHPFTCVFVCLGSPTCDHPRYFHALFLGTRIHLVFARGVPSCSHVGSSWRLSSSLPHVVHRRFRATSDAIVSNRWSRVRQAHDQVDRVRCLCFGWMLLQRLEPSVHPMRSISCSSKCAKNLVLFFPASSGWISNCTFQGKLAEISFPLNCLASPTTCPSIPFRSTPWLFFGTWYTTTGSTTRTASPTFKLVPSSDSVA
mmetsp:Transcript_6307/g.39291  ORF Transcript_6307/g.39291 Transcript_6307/m.39291 type:complete len:209 (+) Transcript_6307:4423-5049(+)